MQHLSPFSPTSSQLVEPCFAAAANLFHNTLVGNGQNYYKLNCVCSSAHHSILDGCYLESFLSISVSFADHDLFLSAENTD